MAHNGLIHDALNTPAIPGNLANRAIADDPTIQLESPSPTTFSGTSTNVSGTNFETPTGPASSPVGPSQTFTPTGTSSQGIIAQAREAPATPTATQIQTDPNQTVAGQVKGLLANESPLVTLARTRTAQAAQKRGLLSSTQALQAGEVAAIQTVLPIAQQDAATAARQAETNATAQNRLTETGFQGLITSGLSAQEAEQRSLQSIQDRLLRGELSSQDATQQSGIIKQQAQIAQNLTQLQGAIEGGLSTQAASQQSLLNIQDRVLRGEISAQDASQQSQLLVQQAQEAGVLSQQDAQQVLKQLDKKNEFNVAFAEVQLNNQKELTKMDSDLRLQTETVLTNLERDNKIEVLNAQGEIAQAAQDSNFTQTQQRELQTQYNNSVLALTTQLNASLALIQSNPDITNKADALTIARRDFKESLNIMNGVFSSSPGWQEGWEVVDASFSSGGSGDSPTRGFSDLQDIVRDTLDNTGATTSGATTSSGDIERGRDLLSQVQGDESVRFIDLSDEDKALVELARQEANRDA